MFPQACYPNCVGHFFRTYVNAHTHIATTIIPNAQILYRQLPIVAPMPMIAHTAIYTRYVSVVNSDNTTDLWRVGIKCWKRAYVIVYTHHINVYATPIIHSVCGL